MMSPSQPHNNCDASVKSVGPQKYSLICVPRHSAVLSSKARTVSQWPRKIYTLLHPLLWQEKEPSTCKVNICFHPIKIPACSHTHCTYLQTHIHTGKRQYINKYVTSLLHYSLYMKPELPSKHPFHSIKKIHHVSTCSHAHTHTHAYKHTSSHSTTDQLGAGSTLGRISLSAR